MALSTTAGIAVSANVDSEIVAEGGAIYVAYDASFNDAFLTAYTNAFIANDPTAPTRLGLYSLDYSTERGLFLSNSAPIHGSAANLTIDSLPGTGEALFQFFDGLTTSGFGQLSDGDLYSDSDSLLADTTGAAATNSELSVIPVPPPTGEMGGSEGGQIPLTAFVAPTGLGLSNGDGTAGLARHKPSTERLRAEQNLGTNGGAPTEGMHGRAVVYEVAHADAHLNGDDISKNSGESDVATHDAADQRQFTPVSMNEVASYEVSAESESYPEAEHRSSAENSGEGFLLSGQFIFVQPQTPDDQSAAASDEMALEQLANSPVTVNSVAHDAAFASWKGVISEPGDAEAVPAPTDNRHRRMLSVGLMVVLGVGPLRKALRRRCAATSTEQQPPHRRVQATTAI